MLEHLYPDKTELPITYPSRTLSRAEENYARLEKEALAILFRVKKFHGYIYGRQFILVTDNKPLSTILGPKKGIPTLSATILQRWAMILSVYQYDMVCKNFEENLNAGALSRLPVDAQREAEIVTMPPAST